MRIVQCEKIFLSSNEMEAWLDFIQFLDELERGSENPNTKNLICKIQSLLDDLGDKMEED